MPHFLTKITALLLLCSLVLEGYSFTMECEKTELMVGEKTHITLTLRYTNLEDYNIEDAKFENFQTTLLKETETQENNSTWVVTQRYALVAQKAGTTTLTSPIAHVESIAPEYQKRYNRNKYLVKKEIHATPCTLNITPLPQGINVTGTYTLSSKVDKHKVKAGEPIRFTVQLQGEGNIEDLSFFTLAIPHTTVYEKATSTNEKYFDIISDSNYTIPAISLEYYNQSSKSIERLSSKAFTIEVTPLPNTQRNKVDVRLMLLILFGGLLYYLWHLFNVLSYVDKKGTFIRILKKIKNKEDLLAKVAPYLHKDKCLDRLIFKLENVESAKFKKLKREIIRQIKLHF